MREAINQSAVQQARPDRPPDEARRAAGADGGTPFGAFQASAIPAELLQDVHERLDALNRANDRLCDELTRCYQHLGVLFDITQHANRLHDPDDLQRLLLTSFAEVLDAAIFLDAGGQCVLAVMHPSQPQQMVPGVPAILPAIRSAIARVRRFGRPQRVTFRPRGESGSTAVAALLGRLHNGRDETTVVIAVRAAGQPAFDAADLLASETVLVYGGSLLRNLDMMRRLEGNALETVRALTNAIDARDNYTRGHSERVGWLARILGEALTLPESELQMLEWAGLLHDVGKIGVPEHVLNKPGALTDAEFEQVKIHPRLGYDVLRPVSSFRPLLEAVLYHHENHDGSGYPCGLRAEQIPLAARIIHIADTFDALTSLRPYRGPMTIEQALAQLETDAGRTTDPRLTRTFIEAIRRRVRDDPDEFVARFRRHALPDEGPRPAAALQPQPADHLASSR